MSMKNLNLNFQQRLGLSNLLAGAQGSLGKLTSLQRVYEAVRFTDEEMGQVKIADLGNGTSAFSPPDALFGHVSAKVEDADATTALQEIDAHQHFRISDMAWVNAVKQQLSAASVIPNKEEK